MYNGFFLKNEWEGNRHGNRERFFEICLQVRRHIYHIENKAGAYIEVSQYGAILVKICVPDKDGRLTDVVLGYDDLESYFVNGCFFGACIGRSGNRIADSRFMIDGQEVKLTPNEGRITFTVVRMDLRRNVWNASVEEKQNAVTFSRISPDGENGFPGEFEVSVTYELTEENAVRIVYFGVSDKATVANMTNHSYFNLNGEGSGTAMDQYLTIHAQEYTPVREDSFRLARMHLLRELRWISNCEANWQRYRG